MAGHTWQHPLTFVHGILLAGTPSLTPHLARMLYDNTFHHSQLARRSPPTTGQFLLRFFFLSSLFPGHTVPCSTTIGPSLVQSLLFHYEMSSLDMGLHLASPKSSACGQWVCWVRNEWTPHIFTGRPTRRPNQERESPTFWSFLQEEKHWLSHNAKLRKPPGIEVAEMECKNNSGERGWGRHSAAECLPASEAQGLVLGSQHGVEAGMVLPTYHPGL